MWLPGFSGSGDSTVAGGLFTRPYISALRGACAKQDLRARKGQGAAVAGTALRFEPNHLHVRRHAIREHRAEQLRNHGQQGNAAPIIRIAEPEMIARLWKKPELPD